MLLMDLRRLLAGKNGFGVCLSLLFHSTSELTLASFLVKLGKQPLRARPDAAMIFMKSLLSGLTLRGGGVQSLV